MSLFTKFHLPLSSLSYTAKGLCSSCSHRSIANYKRIIQEKDILILKNKVNSTTDPILTPPLRSSRKFEVAGRDTVQHDDILGKAIGLGLASSRKRVDYRIYEPTLGEYTDFSPRLVTPIYSNDAALIVSLLDLHPTVPGSHSDADGERLEIFEAGTGHGALTLHLAKAIHGANTAAPAIPSPPQRASSDQEEISIQALELEKEAAYTTWLSNRRAVIHTLDNSAKHSGHAQITVKNFRKGIYFPHIDFHVGTITEYLSKRLDETNGEPFLEHAILDLPSTHGYLWIVKQALKPNGTLITFCPSITQINTCVMYVKENRVPFYLENVLEIGGSVGVGGKGWDIRPVKPRAVLKAEAEQVGNEETVGDELHAPATSSSGWEMVCRPKVGVRTSGGGFVGLWRKMVIES